MAMRPNVTAQEIREILTGVKAGRLPQFIYRGVRGPTLEHLAREGMAVRGAGGAEPRFHAALSEVEARKFAAGGQRPNLLRAPLRAAVEGLDRPSIEKLLAHARGEFRAAPLDEVRSIRSIPPKSVEVLQGSRWTYLADVGSRRPKGLMAKERRAYKTKRGARRGFLRRAAKAGLAGSLTNEELTLGVRVALAEVEGKMSRAEVDKALDDLLGKAKAGRFRQELVPFRRTIRGPGGGVMMPGPPGRGAAGALTAESRRLLPEPGRAVVTPRGPQPQLMAPRRLALPAPEVPPISDSAAKSIGYKNSRSFGAALASGKEGARKAVNRVWSAVAKSKTAGRWGLVGAGVTALGALLYWATSGEDEAQPAPSAEDVTTGAWARGGADIHQLRMMLMPQIQEAAGQATEARAGLMEAMVADQAAQRQFSMSEIPLAMAIQADQMRTEAAEEPKRRQEALEALMIADQI